MDKKQMSFIIIISIILYITFVITIYRKVKRKEKRRKKDYFIDDINAHKIIKIYSIVSRVPIISMYLDYISRCYYVYSPDNSRENKKKTLTYLLTIVLITILEIYFIFIRNPGFFQAIIAIIFTIMINNELLYIVMRNAYIRLLNQMVEFFSDVRHFYYQYASIDYALLDSISKSKKEMKVHGNKIYQVITAKDIDKEIRMYNESISFSYLKLFLSLCVQVMDTGDQEWEGQSIFQMNLHHLKDEVQIEELKQKKMVYIFSGLIFMTITPLLTLDFCKDFGMNNLTELTNFYEGILGIVIYILSIILSIFCYLLQNHQRDSLPIPNHKSTILYYLSNVRAIKSAINGYTERFYTKVLTLKQLLHDSKSFLSYPQFLIKQILYAICTFLLMILFFQYIHTIQINHISQFSFDKSISTMYSSKKLDEIQEKVNIALSSNRLNNRRYNEQFHSISINEIITELDLKDSKIEDYIKQDLLERVQKINKHYFKWYELLISLLISNLSMKIPYVLLLYRRTVRRRNVEEEVTQFQSIILMLMYLKNMSVLSLLQTMEIYADQFRTSIQICMNDFNSGAEEALMRMKYSESYQPFQRLVDNLMVSDSIGIIKAFDELSSERIFFRDRRKQENEIHLTRKQDNATLIAYIPLIFIMIFYLILPFLIQSYIDYQTITMDMY